MTRGAHVSYSGLGRRNSARRRRSRTPPECREDVRRHRISWLLPNKTSNSRRIPGFQSGTDSTDEWHPTQMLADMLTIRDHACRLRPSPTPPQQHGRASSRDRRSAGPRCPDLRPRAASGPSQRGPREHHRRQPGQDLSCLTGDSRRGVAGVEFRLHGRVRYVWESPRRRGLPALWSSPGTRSISPRRGGHDRRSSHHASCTASLPCTMPIPRSVP